MERDVTDDRVIVLGHPGGDRTRRGDKRMQVIGKARRVPVTLMDEAGEALARCQVVFGPCSYARAIRFAQHGMAVAQFSSHECRSCARKCLSWAATGT